MKKILFLLAVVAIGFASCSDNKEDVTVNKGTVIAKNMTDEVVYILINPNGNYSTYVVDDYIDAHSSEEYELEVGNYEYVFFPQVHKWNIEDGNFTIEKNKSISIYIK